MAEYKVRVRKSHGWKDTDTGLVSISQGQECHEGDKLDALLGWAVDAHKSCILNISDTLHRHNLIGLGMDPHEAMQESYRLGNEWIRRNSAILEKYSGKFYTLHRWSDWLYHNDFPEMSAHVLAFYEENEDFRAAMHKDVQGFVTRKAQSNPSADPRAAFQSSLDYMIEETAAYIIISRQYRANRIYPAKPLDTFEYLRSSADVPAPLRGMELSLCVHVNFKRLGAQDTERAAA